MAVKAFPNRKNRLNLLINPQQQLNFPLKPDLHNWQLTTRQAAAIQDQLAAKVREVPLTTKIRFVAAVDCGYRQTSPTITAAAVVFDALSWTKVEEKIICRPCKFPYVPGLLSFREAPAIIETVRRLELQPDLLMCDGQGKAHPRRLGLACHVGLWLRIPAFGVAKSCLCGEYRMPGRNRGCSTRLMHNGEQVGRVLRTRTGVKPVFVSTGHLVTLKEALRWTLRGTRKYRLPEPAREAHRLTRQCS